MPTSSHLGDGGHQQRLHSDPWVVNLLLGKPRVNDVHDAVNGQRRFRNVGRDHNLASWRAAVLTLGRLQQRVYSQYGVVAQGVGVR